jgi:hypothetical protein
MLKKGKCATGLSLMTPDIISRSLERQFHYKTNSGGGQSKIPSIAPGHWSEATA